MKEENEIERTQIEISIEIITIHISIKTNQDFNLIRAVFFDHTS